MPHKDNKGNCLVYNGCLGKRRSFGFLYFPKLSAAIDGEHTMNKSDRQENDFRKEQECVTFALA
jgi:hypothetical protein